MAQPSSEQSKLIVFSPFYVNLSMAWWDIKCVPLGRILYILPGLSKLALCIFIALINFFLFFLFKHMFHCFPQKHLGLSRGAYN